ncbi:hypothetical protein ACTFIY_007514 [Dictyostelium cf. discoideum]
MLRLSFLKTISNNFSKNIYYNNNNNLKFFTTTTKTTTTTTTTNTTTENKIKNENENENEININPNKKLNSKERNILLGKALKLKKKNEKIQSINEKMKIESDLQKNEYDKILNLDKVKLPRCTGCGSTLQTTSPKEPGYLPESIAIKHIEQLNEEKIEKIENSKPIEEQDKSGEEYFNSFYIIKKKNNEKKVCQRCHILKNYGRVAPVAIPIEKFKDNLSQLKDLNCLVVKVVDLMDFNGTFIEDFREIIGRNPVIVVGNKMDLLPDDIHKDRIEQWIRSEAKKRGLSHISHVKLISSASGDGMKQFIIELEKLRKSRDVFIVGCSNVGKSTFVNTLIKEYNNRVEFTTNEKLESKKQAEPLTIQEQKDLDREKLLKSLQSKITTSVLPGTTLNLLSLPLWDNSTLFDTPGIDNPRQMIKNLTIDELKQVIPSKRIKPQLAHMIEGKSLFIGGLVRIDYAGPLSTFMIYTSNSIPLHITSTQKANFIIKRHQGSFLTPPILSGSEFSLDNKNQEEQEQKQKQKQEEKEELEEEELEEGELGNEEKQKLIEKSRQEIIDQRYKKLSQYDLEILEKFKFSQIRTFTIKPEKIDFDHTYIDLVISGLGWISIKSLSKKIKSSKLIIHTPNNIDVSLRPPLIPKTKIYSSIK